MVGKRRKGEDDDDEEEDNSLDEFCHSATVTKHLRSAAGREWLSSGPSAPSGTMPPALLSSPSVGDAKIDGCAGGRGVTRAGTAEPTVWLGGGPSTEDCVQNGHYRGKRL